MTATQLQWSDDVGYWTSILDTPFLNHVTLYFHTAGRDDPPSLLQLRALQHIETLGTEVGAHIDRTIHDFVAKAFSSAVLRELTPEDFEWKIGGIDIPPINKLQRMYYLIFLHSELDPEHGIGIACRDGIDFAFCHANTYDGLDPDDQNALDLPFV